VPAGRQLDEAVVKSLTGGDRVTARFLYTEHFEVVPLFTIWLAANHRPSVRDDDPAIWRRLIVLPFDVTIPEDERDPSIKARLRDPMDAGPAILAWAVEGCLQWQRDGLRVPASVRVAGESYRAEMAMFTNFLEDACDEGVDLWVEAGLLAIAYQNWSTLNGYRYPLGPKAIAERLRSRGHAPEKRKGVREWRGLTVRIPGAVDRLTDWTVDGESHLKKEVVEKVSQSGVPSVQPSSAPAQTGIVGGKPN
jgi:putative DNA primase/helicase